MTVPVKKTPKISDVLQDPVSVAASVQPSVAEQPTSNAETHASEISQASAEPQEREKEASLETFVADVKPEISEVSGKVTDIEAVDTQLETETLQVISSSDEKFKNAWNTMFELLFREIATIYYPLKGVVPQIHHNVIQVKVKNEMMKENFESRVRLALEYLRNNYDPRIDDIKVEIEINPEQSTKLIYDTQDKLNDLKKENPDLPEFLKILNLSAKDM